MSSSTAAISAIPVPDTLGALQQAWAQMATPATLSLPLRESFLNLRDIPQISFGEACGAFPMLDSAYPEGWKEQIRQLRDQLVQAQGDMQTTDASLQILAITNMAGGRPRYGTAANLALTMSSMHDTRILVVDVNLSAPTLHTALRVPASPGLCEATRATRLALPPCFRRITGTQIYLLTIGDVTAYPMDPLDLSGLHVLLRSLRSQFDWIILDGPGFDTPGDALTITTAAEGVIIMIESERDNFREVARALSQVQDRCMLGAVMF